jgi:lipoprotein-anchoring transpeptidase ErfK/SrfK
MAKRAPELKQLHSDVRKAQTAFDRAVRSERRALRRLESAKRRQEAAERRQAAAKKRKEERVAAAAKAKAARAEAAAKRKKTNSSKSTSAFAGGLFSRTDPALKNINDYRARKDGEFSLAAIPTDKLDKRLLRQQVRYRTRHKPGTLVVDTKEKYLYLVQFGGRAMRYGIGVGKAGFEWSGAAKVGWKREWPTWTPPNEMIARKPRLRKWSAKNGGMPGGPKNPLGARALYLMQGGVDTLYRLHGTPEWKSIGTAASSGCIRLMNQDIIDLYKRVPNGAKVVVI